MPNRNAESNAADLDGASDKGGGGGQSQGGAYPNQQRGKPGRGGGFMGHGGQSEIAYHGKGQLGEDHSVEGENANAPAKGG